MANKKTGFKGTMDGANTYELGDIGSVGGTMLIEIDATAFVGTGAILKAKGRDGATYKAIPYTPLHLNGAVGDMEPASTAITGASLIQIVIADGMSLMLDLSGVGAYTSGSLAYQVYPTGAK